MAVPFDKFYEVLLKNRGDVKATLTETQAWETEDLRLQAELRKVREMAAEKIVGPPSGKLFTSAEFNRYEKYVLVYQTKGFEEFKKALQAP